MATVAMRLGQFQRFLSCNKTGPVVKTSPSNAGGASLILGQGAKIPHDLACLLAKKKTKKKKQKQNRGLHTCDLV